MTITLVISGQRVNRKTNGLLNSHLTGFTRSLLTNAVGLCQVKAYYTELAAASLYMAVETNHSQMHLTLTLVVVNEIHSLIFMTHLTRVRVHEGLDGLGLNSGLACHFLLNFWKSF